MLGITVWMASLVAFGGAPPSDAEFLDWTCGHPLFPLGPDTPLDLPVADSGGSQVPRVSTLVKVDVNGEATFELAPRGGIAVAIDGSLPAARAYAVLTRLVQQNRLVFVVLEPQTPPEPRPVLPEVDERIHALCGAGGDVAGNLASELSGASARCPAIAPFAEGWSGSESCSAHVRTLGGVLAQCPDERETVLAVAGCAWQPALAMVAASPFVLVRLVDPLPPAPVPATGTWAELWPSITTPSWVVAPPVPTKVRAPPPVSHVPAFEGLRAYGQDDVRIRRNPPPRYPDAAKWLNLGDQRCVAAVAIDEKGVPSDVKISACPKVFWEGTRQALLRWRWYGVPEPGQVGIAVIYKLERPPPEGPTR